MGFTLIELLIVLVAVAIISAIAIPSYFNYQLRARRAEGIGALNTIQLNQEKYRTYNASYGTLANAWGAGATTANGFYLLTITNPTASGYTASATAQGNQVNDTQSGTACNVLTLTVNGLTTTQTPAVCWSR